MKHAMLLIMLGVMMLPACADREAATDVRQDEASGDSALPAPARSTGPVTGMPDKPAPAEPAPVTGQAPVENAIVVDGSLDAANPETGLLPGGGVAAGSDDPAIPVSTPVEPTPDDAVAVIRDYYDSINSRSYARAYSLWSDEGRSSGQSPQQFADGFAGTAQVAIAIQKPGPVEAAAGSRYIEVPVAINATTHDGRVRGYTGSYVLRRAVVDGASAEQRAWRIASADLREVKP